MIRQTNLESARIGNDSSLAAYRYSQVSSINSRISKFAVPIETFEWDLHDLWHAYYHATINTSHESPNMDSLAFQLLQTKAQGVLMGRGLQIEEAITSDGKIWTDLPFLFPDMTSYWINDYAKMSASHRLNLSSSLAKLASVGLNNDRLSGIALILLRDALETKRPLEELLCTRQPKYQMKLPTPSVAQFSIWSILPLRSTTASKSLA
jgi:hypothetical protein